MQNNPAMYHILYTHSPQCCSGKNGQSDGWTDVQREFLNGRYTIISHPFKKRGIWSRGQIRYIYRLFCEFVAHIRKKNLVTIFSQGNIFGLDMFY